MLTALENEMSKSNNYSPVTPQSEKVILKRNPKEASQSVIEIETLNCHPFNNASGQLEHALTWLFHSLTDPVNSGVNLY